MVSFTLGSSTICNCSGIRFLKMCAVFLLLMIFSVAARAQFTTSSDGNGGLIITGYSGSSAAITIPATITVGGTPENVTTIGSGAFSYSSPTSITVSAGITTIQSDAFSVDTALTSISLPSTLTTIGASAFYYCTSLTSVTIPASVTSIGDNAFKSCTALALASFLGNAPTMGAGVFLNAPNTFSVMFPYNATGFASPTWTDSSNDSYPATAVYPYTTTSDGSGGLVITAYTGSDATVSVPSTINGLSVTSIGASSFHASGVANVTIPSGVTSIGDSTFFSCASLTSITLPDTLTTIGAYAFSLCQNLLSVTIPASVTSIGDAAFEGPTYPGHFAGFLGNVTFLGNAPTMGQSVFFNANGSPTVYYYSGATGFTTPSWTDSSGDVYSTVELTSTDLFGGVVKPSGYKKSAWFGTYAYNQYPLVYQFYLGYEYAYDAGGGGVYLYDYASGHFWYTNPTDFPIVYDFSLAAYLYYYEVNTPHRHFYNFNTSQIFTQ